MKKIISLLLILVLACSLVACGTENIGTDPEGTPVESGESTGESTETPNPDPEHEKDTELKEGGLSVNPEYLSLFGKNKGQVDAMFGQGEFWREWALMVYKNGIQVSYGTYNTNGDLDDFDMVYRMYLPLKYLFNDCPATVTEDDIKNTFVNVKEEYSEEEGTSILIATYKGKHLMFYPEWGMDPETCVDIAN